MVHLEEWFSDSSKESFEGDNPKIVYLKKKKRLLERFVAA